MMYLRFLLLFSILTAFFTLTAVENSDVSTSQQMKELKALNNQLNTTNDRIKKIEILFKVLELKFINNTQAEEDIKLLDELLSHDRYGKNHARADFLSGNILKINGAGNMSIERYYRAFQFYSKINDSENRTRLALAIAENLRAFEGRQKALEYLRLATSIWSNKNDRLTAEINDRYSAVFFELCIDPEYIKRSKKNLYADSCEYFGLKSLEFSKKNKDYPLIVSTGTILGALKKFQNNSVLALLYLNLAKEAAEKSGRLADKSLTMANISRVYEMEGNMDKALETILESYQLAVKSNIKIYILMSSQVIYEYYKKRGDYQKSLYYLEIYQKYRDMIYEEDKNRQIILTTTKLDLDLKKKENELLKKEQELQKSRISRQNSNLIILLISLIFAFTLTFVFYFYYLRTKRLNKKIQDEHLKVLQLEKIKSVYAMAVTANHELNQPLTVLKGNIEMLEMTLPDISQKHIKYIDRINESYRKIIQILQKYRENTPLHFEIYAEDEVMVVFEDEHSNPLQQDDQNINTDS